MILKTDLNMLPRLAWYKHTVLGPTPAGCRATEGMADFLALQVVLLVIR